MLRAVVADTGPLNYLLLIDQVRILPALFEAVLVPDAVSAELSHRETPSLVREWMASPPPWLAIYPTPEGWAADFPSLDEGERAAIALALSLRADLVLMDDRAGVAVARAKGLVVTGTLGLLDLAARRGLVDLTDAFQLLRKTSFRYRPDVLEAILAKHAAGR